MPRLLALGLLLAAVAAAGPARAQGSDARSAWRRWYGWQLVAADAAAAGLVLAPIDDDARGATIGIGMTALFMNGPIVHMANRNPRRASLSLVRVPAFLLGRLAGFGLGHGLCQQTGCKGPMQTWGGILGLGGVMLWDWVAAVRPERSEWAATHDPGDDDLPVIVPRPAPGRLALPFAPGLPLAAGRF
jgi:hypothetical protein